MSAYRGAGLLSYGPCRFYSCHFSLSLPQEQHCPHVCHIFLQQARGGEDGRYVEGCTDGCWLLLLISPRVVLATDWWEWWERGGEEVFKERLSGVEWLSYGVRWRLETSRTALLRLYEWWDWILHLGPRQGGVGGRNALYSNCSCLLWGGDLRPPRECSFTTFVCVFIHFFVVYYIIPSVGFDFLTCIINSLYTDNNSRCLILPLDICCQYHFTSAVLFCVHSFPHAEMSEPQRGKMMLTAWCSCRKEAFVLKML